MNVFKTITNYLFSKLSKLQLALLVVLLFCAFIISDSSVFDRISYNSKIRGLKSEINYYKEKSEEDRRKFNELHSNKDNIEKFARENYLMKKENEDVFVIE